MIDEDPVALTVMGGYYLTVAVVALLCTVALMEFTSMDYAAAMMLAASGTFGIGFFLSVVASAVSFIQSWA